MNFEDFAHALARRLNESGISQHWGSLITLNCINSYVYDSCPKQVAHENMGVTRCHHGFTEDRRRGTRLGRSECGGAVSEDKIRLAIRYVKIYVARHAHAHARACA